MNVRNASFIAAIVLIALAGCSPNERRAGITLSGTDAAWPADWRFVDATKEIQIQAKVRAAYATKYQLNADAGAATGEVRYWHVVAPAA